VVKRGLALVLVLVLARSVLAGCGTKAPEPAKKMKIGLVYDVGGKGDKSFNDSAFAGLEKAKAEFAAKADFQDAEPSKDGSNRETLVRTFAQQGYDLIIGVGFLFDPTMAAVSKEFPNVKFATVDGSLPDPAPANLMAMSFKANEGSFLAGAAAALATKKNNIGFIGGMEGDLFRAFEMGYQAGALSINPKIKIQSKYIGTDGSAFANPTLGKEYALAQIEKGADVVYHASGQSGAGVIAACAQKKVLAIGVDSDQSLTASAEEQPYILTSALKRVDNAVYATIKSVIDGTFKGGVYATFDLKNDGVGYASNQFNASILTADMKTKLDALKAKIVSGEIKVPSTQAELDTFKASLPK
jgi:basic membrane protein A